MTRTEFDLEFAYQVAHALRLLGLDPDSMSLPEAVDTVIRAFGDRCLVCKLRATALGMWVPGSAAVLDGNYALYATCGKCSSEAVEQKVLSRERMKS